MQTNKTGSWQAQWITASDDMLSGIERFPGGGVPMGKWIWPQAAVRVYMRRDFTVDGPVRTARLRFQCDNEFTLYINGHTVRPRRDGALWDTGVADAAGLLTAGVNHLGVRAFQSADPARFTAALRGGIHIELEDGSERDELTGDDWSAWRVCGFYEQREPGGWDSAPEPGARWGLLSQSIHPWLLRRSCYFRTDFDAPGGVRSAVLRATARGLFEAYINGRRVAAFARAGSARSGDSRCSPYSRAKWGASRYAIAPHGALSARRGPRWTKDSAGSSRYPRARRPA